MVYILFMMKVRDHLFILYHMNIKMLIYYYWIFKRKTPLTAVTVHPSINNKHCCGVRPFSDESYKRLCKIDLTCANACCVCASECHKLYTNAQLTFKCRRKRDDQEQWHKIQDHHVCRTSHENLPRSFLNWTERLQLSAERVPEITWLLPVQRQSDIQVSTVVLGRV